MNLPIAHHIYSSKPTAFLLLMLMLIIPLSAHATPYVYTYTGNVFQTAAWDFTTYDYIEYTFTYDREQPDLTYPPITVQVGLYSFTSNPNFFDIREWSQGGLPISWLISVPESSLHLNTASNFIATDGGGSDVASYYSGNPAAGNDNNPGVWKMLPSAPVPEPATLMLLGSGLLGLAGFRRKMKK